MGRRRAGNLDSHQELIDVSVEGTEFEKMNLQDGRAKSFADPGRADGGEVAFRGPDRTQGPVRLKR